MIPVSVSLVPVPTSSPAAPTPSSSSFLLVGQDQKVDGGEYTRFRAFLDKPEHSVLIESDVEGAWRVPRSLRNASGTAEDLLDLGSAIAKGLGDLLAGDRGRSW